MAAVALDGGLFEGSYAHVLHAAADRPGAIGTGTALSDADAATAVRELERPGQG